MISTHQFDDNQVVVIRRPILPKSSNSMNSKAKFHFQRLQKLVIIAGLQCSLFLLPTINSLSWQQPSHWVSLSGHTSPSSNQLQQILPHLASQTFLFDPIPDQEFQVIPTSPKRPSTAAGKQHGATRYLHTRHMIRVPPSAAAPKSVEQISSTPPATMPETNLATPSTEILPSSFWFAANEDLFLRALRGLTTHTRVQTLTTPTVSSTTTTSTTTTTTTEQPIANFADNNISPYYSPAHQYPGFDHPNRQVQQNEISLPVSIVNRFPNRVTNYVANMTAHDDQSFGEEKRSKRLLNKQKISALFGEAMLLNSNHNAGKATIITSSSTPGEELTLTPWKNSILTQQQRPSLTVTESPMWRPPITTVVTPVDTFSGQELQHEHDVPPPPPTTTTTQRILTSLNQREHRNYYYSGEAQNNNNLNFFHNTSSPPPVVGSNYYCLTSSTNYNNKNDHIAQDTIRFCQNLTQRRPQFAQCSFASYRAICCHMCQQKKEQHNPTTPQYDRPFLYEEPPPNVLPEWNPPVLASPQQSASSDVEAAAAMAQPTSRQQPPAEQNFEQHLNKKPTSRSTLQKLPYTCNSENMTDQAPRQLCQKIYKQCQWPHVRAICCETCLLRYNKQHHYYVAEKVHKNLKKALLSASPSMSLLQVLTQPSLTTRSRMPPRPAQLLFKQQMPAASDLINLGEYRRLQPFFRARLVTSGSGEQEKLTNFSSYAQTPSNNNEAEENLPRKTLGPLGRTSAPAAGGIVAVRPVLATSTAAQQPQIVYGNISEKFSTPPSTAATEQSAAVDRGARRYFTENNPLQIIRSAPLILATVPTEEEAAVSRPQRAAFHWKPAWKKTQTNNFFNSKKL